jgi:hypothetical protein
MTRVDYITGECFPISIFLCVKKGVRRLRLEAIPFERVVL